MSGLHQPQRNLLHLYHGRGETWLQPTVDVNANAVKDAGLDTIAAPGGGQSRGIRATTDPTPRTYMES